MDLVIHTEVTAHNVDVSTVVLFPVGITENQHSVGFFGFIRLIKKASQVGLDSQHVKVMRGNNTGGDPRWFLAIQQDEPHSVIFLQQGESTCLLAVILNVLGGESHAVIGLCDGLPQDHKLVTLRVRQRLQQYSVNHAE